MSALFVALFAFVASSFRTRAALQAEILALRHQIVVFQKNAPRRLRFQRSDRFLWVLLSRSWPGWRRSLHIVCPDTVIAWHRRAFAWYWTRKSGRRPGRPNVAAEIRNLIRNMSQANPLWGAPRVHGELLKLGIEVAQSTVAKYLRRPQKPPLKELGHNLAHLSLPAVREFYERAYQDCRLIYNRLPSPRQMQTPSRSGSSCGSGAEVLLAQHLLLSLVWTPCHAG